MKRLCEQASRVVVQVDEHERLDRDLMAAVSLSEKSKIRLMVPEGILKVGVDG